MCGKLTHLTDGHLQHGEYLQIMGKSPIHGKINNFDWAIFQLGYVKQHNQRLQISYPLVNCHITMENHHFQWENPL